MGILKLDEYSRYLREDEKSAGTIRNYMTALEPFEEYLQANDINTLSKDTLINYKDILSVKYPNKTTLNNKIIFINRYLSWAIEEEELFNSPLEKLVLKKAKVQNKIFRDHININEFNRLINVIDRKDILLFVLVAANVGIRISEITSLKKSDLDKKIIYVYNKGKYQPKSIPIWLRKELRKYMKDKEEDDIIFNLSHQRYRQKLKDAAKKARIKPSKVYPHSLRHLFGTDWVNNNGSVAVLQQLLGHSSIRTTEIYTKVSEDDIAAHYKKQNKGKRSKALKNLV